MAGGNSSSISMRSIARAHKQDNGRQPHVGKACMLVHTHTHSASAALPKSTSSRFIPYMTGQTAKPGKSIVQCTCAEFCPTPAMQQRKKQTASDIQ
eukprot:scaffold89744_cov19-Tisochrysis_lutea.AAC.1